MTTLQTSLPPLQSIPAVITQFMQTAQQSLVHLITSLQSDQLLQQMRNDHNLYHQKINYINQIIQQNFILEPINTSLLQQIHSLTQIKQQLQSRLQASKQEYIAELNTIEIQYNQFLLSKENQKRLMQNIIEQKNHQIFILNKDFMTKVKDLQILKDQIQKQLEKYKKTLNDTKGDLQQKIRENTLLKKEISELKKLELDHQESTKAKTNQLSYQFTSLQKQNAHLNSKMNELQILLKQSSMNEQTYLQTIQQMKQDMFLIKQEWQKRCEQLQRDLTDEYRSKLIAQQEELNQRLKLYVEELKMGKNVIIESSQEILESKKQLMQERFNVQIKRYEGQIAQLQSELQSEKKLGKQTLGKLKETSEKLLVKEKQFTQVKDTLEKEIKVKESLLKSKQQELEQKLIQTKSQTDKEIERLRKTQNMLLKDLKASKQEKQQILKQVHSLKEEFNNYKEKQIKQAKRLKELQQSNQTSGMKILQLKKDLAIMGEKSSMDEKTIKDKNNEISRLEGSLSQIKHDYKQMDAIKKKMEVKIAEMNLKVKQHERIKAEAMHKVQKLYLAVRKLAKQLNLVKQDIIFQLNVQKPKLQSMILSMPEHINTRQQSLKQSHKQKMRQLLNDIEEQRSQQHQQQDELLRENQNMKKQIKLLEQVMREKQEDYLYKKERAVTMEVEKCRVVMQEEINKEKEERRRWQEKVYNQQKIFEYNIAKSQKQVMKQVSGFMTKWENKLGQAQELSLVKEKAIKDLTSQLKRLTETYQETSKQLALTEQKLNKQQQKYESLKQERDKTIDQMMKRLEKETKHKLTLQKQLKDIRGQIMKTQINTNSSSPFNNYSFTDRQNAIVYTNAFHTTTMATQQKIKGQNNQTHVKQSNREKELSQIREMIARTYKVVEGGAEKDQPLPKGRLF